MAFNIGTLLLVITSCMSAAVIYGNEAHTGPGRVQKMIIVPGKVVTNPNKTAHISPRYEGLVKNVFKKAGDSVEKGSVLAIIEQNNVVSNYTIRSPISGIILRRNINPGEFVNQDQKAFRISDIRTVWVDFEVRPHKISQFKKGIELRILSRTHEHENLGKIFYVSPTVEESTRTIRVSVEIKNNSGNWAPGKVVEGHLLGEIVNLPHVISRQYLKQEGSKTFTYVKIREVFKKKYLRIGIADDKQVEVLSGIPLGAIVTNSAPLEGHQDEGRGHGH